MKNIAFVSIAKLIFNILYHACDFLPRKNEVLFVSRQTDEPSRDYLSCGKEFDSRGLKPIYLTKKLKKKNVIPYAFHALREIYHLARCKVCFVDRYDPMIGLINFKCVHEQGDCSGALHVDYPIEPTVIQIWHAFGAFKKFGYQAADTTEGHTDATLKNFGIHKNYSWIICSGEGCRDAFAQAFSYPVERVLPLCRPEYSDLLDSVARGGCFGSETETIKVLMAPTLRKSKESKHPFHGLKRQIEERKDIEGLQIKWCFHPLEQGGSTGGQIPPNLLEADYIVTDYSSIVYEAYLLKKRVVFYAPDIEEYRVSPGLNVDPGILCSDLVFTTVDDLLQALDSWRQGAKEYPQDQLDSFAAESFGGAPSNPAVAIVDFVMVNCSTKN